MIGKPLKPVGQISHIEFVTKSSEYVSVRKEMKPFPKLPALQPPVKCQRYYEYIPLSQFPAHIDIDHELNIQLEVLEPYRKMKIRRAKAI